MPSKSKARTVFHIRINGGKERTMRVKSGIYDNAVAAVPATFGLQGDKFPLTIEIWVPNLLPDYGPYTYAIEKPGGPILSVVERPDGSKIYFST